jgi:sirohydrochlorin cobaltochelatase
MVRTAIVLVGHGQPASDCPAYLVFKLKQLEGRRRALGGEPGDDERELQNKIRRWPRTADNDAYSAGLDALAQRLRARLPEGVQIATAYCEYCLPTLEEAVASFLEGGVDRVVVVPCMLTPGNVHSEVDVPRVLEGLSWRFPDADLQLAWPLDPEGVAELLVSHLRNKVSLT